MTGHPTGRPCVRATREHLADWFGPVLVTSDHVEYIVFGYDRASDRYLLVPKFPKAPVPMVGGSSRAMVFYDHVDHVWLPLDRQESLDRFLRVFATKEKVECGNSPPRWVRWESCGGTAWILAGESWCSPDAEGGERSGNDYGKWFYADEGQDDVPVTAGLAELPVDSQLDLRALVVCWESRQPSAVSHQPSAAPREAPREQPRETKE